MRPLFELQNVTLARAGETVLEEISATVPAGASCVAGPSGSGKSTLLRLLNRLADPDRGSIGYRGQDVRSYEVLALRREVCLVPQLPALLDETVADNVTFGARLAGRACEVERFLSLVGLDPSFAIVKLRACRLASSSA
jgi:putative ABC transport system ATP-binding protein